MSLDDAAPRSPRPDEGTDSGRGNATSPRRPGTNLALTPNWSQLPMTGGVHASTQADPPPGAGAAGGHARGRVPGALAVPGAAGPGVRAGRAAAGRPDAQPAAGGLRAGLVGGPARPAGHRAQPARRAR